MLIFQDNITGSGNYFRVYFLFCFFIRLVCFVRFLSCVLSPSGTSGTTSRTSRATSSWCRRKCRASCSGRRWSTYSTLTARRQPHSLWSRTSRSSDRWSTAALTFFFHPFFSSTFPFFLPNSLIICHLPFTFSVFLFPPFLLWALIFFISRLSKLSMSTGFSSSAPSLGRRISSGSPI